jgi:antitoxin ParD1/3/4
MRTNIDINDQLMQAAMAAGQFSTKRETVAAALKIMADRKVAYSHILALGGRVEWVGDLDAQRRDIPTNEKSASSARASQFKPQIKPLSTARPATKRAKTSRQPAFT